MSVISQAAAAAAKALARRFVREFGKRGAQLITRRVGRAALRELAEGLPAKIEAHILEHADEVLGKAKHTLLKSGITKEELLRLIRETVQKGGKPILSEMSESGQLAWVFEREFKDAVGEKGQKILRVVVDKAGRIVTTFPVDNLLKRLSIRGILVSGQLAAFAFLTILLESEAQAAVADITARRKAFEDSKTWFETGLEWIGPFGIFESSPIGLEPNFDEIRRRTALAIAEATKSLERNLSKEESEVIGREIYNVWQEALFVGPN
jgi:hypothetical protein